MKCRVGWSEILSPNDVFIPVWIWPGCPFGPPVWIASSLRYWGTQLYWSLLVQLLLLDLRSLSSKLGIEGNTEHSLQWVFSSSSWEHYITVSWLLVAGVLHVPDMSLWEPNQIVIIAMMTCFAVIPCHQLHLLVPAWQFISISMYFFAGLGKINADFVAFVLPNMLNTIVRPIVLPESLLRFSQYAIPVFETVTPALLLVFGKYLHVRRVLSFALVVMHVNIIVYIIRSGHPPIILPWNIFHLLVDGIIFFPADPDPIHIAIPQKKGIISSNNKIKSDNSMSAVDAKEIATATSDGILKMWTGLMYVFFLVLPTLSALYPPLVPHGGLGMKIFVLPGDCKWSLWTPKSMLDVVCPESNADSISEEVDPGLCSLLRFLEDSGPKGRDMFQLAWDYNRLTPRGGLTTHSHLQYSKNMCRRVSSIFSGARAINSPNQTRFAAEMIWNTLTFSFYTAAHRKGGRHVTTLGCAAVEAATSVVPTEPVDRIRQLQSAFNLTIRNEGKSTVIFHSLKSDGKYPVEFRNDMSQPVQLMWHSSNVTQQPKIQALLKPKESHRRIATSHNTLWSYRVADSDGNFSTSHEIRRFYSRFPSIFVEAARTPNEECASCGQILVTGHMSERVHSGNDRRFEVCVGTTVYLTPSLPSWPATSLPAVALVPPCDKACGQLVVNTDMFLHNYEDCDSDSSSREQGSNSPYQKMLTIECSSSCSEDSEDL